MIATALKLNLGARNRPIPGFLGIDCDAHPGVDVVADVADLSLFETGSVAEVYASHILEHFPHPRTTAVLREWARALMPGGILYVAVPDFSRAVELYQRAGLADWVVNYLWGDQGYATAFHYAGFDEHRLRALLLDTGFSEASRVDTFPVGHPGDCSTNISNIDLKPVSLNIVAVR